MSETIDIFDRKIIRQLQEDCAVSVEQLAEIIGLSKNATWRRLRHLEQSGTIKKRVAIIDPVALGLEATAIVMVRTNDHSAEWLEKFRKAVLSIPNIQSVYRMTGDLDYMIKVRIAGISDYDNFYQRLVALVKLSDVSASFVMEEIRETTAIPVDL